jgi:hypothetical protein
LSVSGNRGKNPASLFRRNSLLHKNSPEVHILGVFPPDLYRFQKNNKLFIRKREKACYTDEEESSEKTLTERETEPFPQSGEGISINGSNYAQESCFFRQNRIRCRGSVFGGHHHQQKP